MAEAPSAFASIADPGSTPMERLRHFAAQPAVRKALPWFAGLGGAGLLALTWAVMAPAPQRVLYSQISDNDRAQVVAALDQASIAYRIDNTTGALTVGEEDLYRARMTVAANGALAAPETGSQMLDSLPLGASRTLEGERMRAAKQRDLELTIGEIDGIEAVRVHLAEPERSVFVRDNAPPKASVMVRLANGRQLAESQVRAIANLVAGSVPDLPIDAVRIVDQHGRLVSERDSTQTDRVDMQARMEEKLRLQLDRLLTPMFGAGNFSSEIQVDLDLAETTSARESYDKDGVVRREEQSQSRSSEAQAAAGVPGATSNTPPPPTAAANAPPQPTQPAGAAGAGPVNDQSNLSRTYELGREVAVSSTGPGGIRRLSVAVALSAAAMKQAKPADIQKLEQLVAAAVGVNPQRGDTVAIAIRPFEASTVAEPAFYETPWFATILRQAGALLALLLVLLLAVRPLLKLLRPTGAGTAPDADGDEAILIEARAATEDERPIDQDMLTRQIGYLQRMVDEKPDRAAIALREMLEGTEEQSENSESQPT